MMPFGFCIAIPAGNVNAGILILQTMGVYGMKMSLQKHLEKCIDDLNMGFQLMLRTIAPKEYIEQYLKHGRLNKIRMIRYEIPQQEANRLGIDQEKEQIEITAKQNPQGELYEGEALAAQIMGGMIDVLALPEDISLQWLYQDVFADLSEILTADQLRAYEDMLLYVDGAVLEKMDHLSQQENPLQFPDPTKPEEMEDPIPVAVRVLDGSEFADVFFSNQQSIVIGIVANAPNPENAVFFVDYVVE